jgi:hypothetical protein|tara:strand:- start:11037 stop:11258 length:222 start_codon:yes stop_codon:yes gene_type:complete
MKGEIEVTDKGDSAKCPSKDPEEYLRISVQEEYLALRNMASLCIETNLNAFENEGFCVAAKIHLKRVLDTAAD